MRGATPASCCEPLAAAWKSHARDAVAIGTSGTIESVQSVLIANGFDTGPITREGVARTRTRHHRTALGFGSERARACEPERVDIFPAGLAALSAMLEMLDIERIEFVDASLQHGLLYDLAARRTLENVQERTMEGWQRRFAVDRAQALRVARLALAMFDDVAQRWDLDEVLLRRATRMGRRSARDRPDGFGAPTQPARRISRRKRRPARVQRRGTASDRVADPQPSRRISDLCVCVVSGE